MQDLKDITNNVHYENFRYKRLSSSASKKGNEEKFVILLLYFICICVDSMTFIQILLLFAKFIEIYIHNSTSYIL